MKTNKFRYHLVFQTGLLIVLIVCFLCAFSCNSSKTGSSVSNTPASKKITAETAYEMMQKSKDFILLDVRTDSEFQAKRIEGAILIPDYEIEKRAASELPDKNTAIFVYCRSGGRSANAAKILAEKAYTQVFDFGGIMNWPYETVSGN